MCLVFDTTNKNLDKETKESKEKNKQDLQLLNDVWKVVTKFAEPAVIFKNLNIA